MIFFLTINYQKMTQNYLNLEKENKRQPSNGWFNFYIIVHFLKAPLLAPLIFTLILRNGGKLLDD
tara:strand:+ start:35903 stop:36097 length:195 start_codon:yes stop_codon:yes gene_type:complete